MELNSNEVSFRELRIEDFGTVLHWSENERFCEANGWPINRDHDELLDWWKRCVLMRRSDFIRLGMEYQNKLIGYVDLAEMKSDSAEIGIAIGESKLWNGGIGTQAVKKLIGYASEQFGISTFYGDTHETNHRSRKMMEKLGFTEVSRIGSEVYLGTEVDLVQYKLDLNG